MDLLEAAAVTAATSSRVVFEPMSMQARRTDAPRGLYR